jgi:hypothetical protein
MSKQTALQDINTSFMTSKVDCLILMIVSNGILSVSQTDWMGGDSLYSNLEEGGPYFYLTKYHLPSHSVSEAGSYWFVRGLPFEQHRDSVYIRAERDGCQRSPRQQFRNQWADFCILVLRSIQSRFDGMAWA